MFNRLLTICAATLLLAACETASMDSNEVVGSSSEASSGSDAAASASSNTSSSSSSGSGSASADAMPSPDELLAKVGSTVYFDYDQSTLTSEAQATLDRQAAFLKANPSVRIVIEGHCDERGTREYNLALGDRRASAARDYLVAKGVNASRLTTISYGKERPEIGGSNETSWALN
ncbi:peptidoglycan-associated lipoprotein Pal, partial [Alphaproteobacteria bacterium]|nr:peptidoglycan-associated lipoprotein Pal [Alphaproteobacteria bacterium]